MTSVSYPKIMTEAEAMCRAAAGVYVAGGTALQLQWDGTRAPVNLIDLSGIVGQRGISAYHGGLRIGAGVSIEQCRTQREVAAHAPLLARTCAEIAAFSIRNLATLGGNISWRLGDTLPALLCLDASVELTDGTPVLLDAFLEDAAPLATLPLIVAIHLPAQRAHNATFFEKVGHRAAFSPTSALVCGSLSLDEHGMICHARLAVSGQGIVATRLRCAEKFLIGQSTLSTNWRNDFERTIAQSLRHAPALQGKILTALLTGHLYQVCERMP